MSRRLKQRLFDINWKKKQNELKRKVEERKVKEGVGVGGERSAVLF